MRMHYIVWLNLVRDAYAKHHGITEREATRRLTAYCKTPLNDSKLYGLHNSDTSETEAAKQIGVL
jgi:hypothetical protein